MSELDKIERHMSSYERLMLLPDIFKGSDANMLFGWKSATTATYVAKWARTGMVRPLGGRSGIYFNLVVDRNYDLERGLRRVLPMATMTGVDVLREAGWTTQILQRREVAIPDKGPSYDIKDYDLQPRSMSWFMLTEQGVEDEGRSLRRLKPEWALADVIRRGKDRRHKSAWMLAPDDLDLEAAREAPAMEEALAAFRLDMSDLEYDAYGRTFDDLLEWRFQTTGHPTIAERLPVRPNTPRDRG